MKQLVQRVFNAAGLEVRRASVNGFDDANYLDVKRRELVTELYSCLKELVFPDLPERPWRHELLAKLIGTPVGEATYLIAHLTRCADVPGDVCEFGIAQGATSALLANEIRGSAKHLWLFDSFQGLPKPTAKDALINDIFNLGSIERYEGTMATPIEMVQQRLAHIAFPSERTHIIAGFIEKTMHSSKLPERVCFAYVDFDFYEPILTTLRLLRPRMSAGATVIVDDYGFFSAGAKTAVDEFVAEAGGEIELTLPRPCAAVVTPFCILRKI